MEDLVTQFIINLMSQHVIPFWITLGILFFIVVEITYFKSIKTKKYRESLRAFTVNLKIRAIFLTASIFLAIYGLAILLEVLLKVIIELLVLLGIIFLVVGYFYVNYLFAKKYAKQAKHEHKFKAGNKLRLIDKYESCWVKEGDKSLTRAFIYQFVKNDKYDFIKIKSLDSKSSWYGKIRTANEKYFEKIK